MARLKFTVAALAKEANLPLDDSMILLKDAGLDIHTGTTEVSRRNCARARRALRLPRTPVSSSDRSITSIASRAGLGEVEARTRLVRAGILKKRRLVRLPRALLPAAERELGIRPPLTETKAQNTTPLPSTKRRKPAGLAED